MLLTASSVLGVALGGLLVAGSLALSLLGGILAWFETRSDEADSGSAATPQQGNGQRLWIAGAAAGVVLLIATGVLGSKADSPKASEPVSAQHAVSPAHADDSPIGAPSADPVPTRKVGDAIAGETFRVTVTSVRIASDVGGDIILETASPGAEYVAVE